jgi:hypothetical protein
MAASSRRYRLRKRNPHRAVPVDNAKQQFGDACMSFETRAPEYKEADRRAGNQPIVPATRARQGVTGHNVRYVLGFGIAAVVVAFVIVYIIYVS